MYLDDYKRWMDTELEDPALTEELKSIEGKDDEIKDRFAVALKFGTAGLRGVLGAGSNRMNIYVVRQAAGHGVIASVDDGAVGLGGAAADILLFFQDADAGRAAGQLPGGGCAGDARAYYDYIVHRYSFLFCAYFRTYRYLQ